MKVLVCAVICSFWCSSAFPQDVDRSGESVAIRSPRSGTMFGQGEEIRIVPRCPGNTKAMVIVSDGRYIAASKGCPESFVVKLDPGVIGKVIMVPSVITQDGRVMSSADPTVIFIRPSGFTKKLSIKGEKSIGLRIGDSCMELGVYAEGDEALLADPIDVAEWGMINLKESGGVVEIRERDPKMNVKVVCPRRIGTGAVTAEYVENGKTFTDQVTVVVGDGVNAPVAPPAVSAVKPPVSSPKPGEVWLDAPQLSPQAGGPNASTKRETTTMVAPQGKPIPYCYQLKGRTLPEMTMTGQTMPVSMTIRVGTMPPRTPIYVRAVVGKAASSKRKGAIPRNVPTEQRISETSAKYMLYGLPGNSIDVMIGDEKFKYNDVPVEKDTTVNRSPQITMDSKGMSIVAGPMIAVFEFEDTHKPKEPIIPEVLPPLKWRHPSFALPVPTLAIRRSLYSLVSFEIKEAGNCREP